MLKNNNKNNEPIDCLSALIDAIPDPVIVIDNTQKIKFANKVFEKITGQKKERLIGKNFCTLGSAGEEYKLLQAKNATDRSESSNIPPYELRLTTMNGVIKCLRANGNRFINAGETLDLAIFHDITEEKNIQNDHRQGLVESEEKIEGISNSIKEAIVVVDNQAKVTYWNPAAEKIFGYISKEAVGKDIHELVVPSSMCREGKERIALSVKTFTQTGMGYFAVGNVELVGRRKDGSEFPAELSISPTKLGGKWNAVGVVKDITQRKQAEQKLRDAEQRYHAIFNQAPLGVLVIDPETTGFVEFNDIAHLQSCYSREEFEKLTVCDIEGKETPDQVRAHLKEMLEAGKAEFETLHRTKNGDIKNSLVSARTFKSAGKTFLHVVYRDITEMKKVQEALIKSEELSRAIVANAPIGIATSDPSYYFARANEAFCRILGYTEDELKKLTFKEITHPKDLQDSIKKMNALEDGKISSLVQEKRYFKKDGSIIVGRVIVNAIRNQLGQVILFISELEDITKSKQLEDDLRSSEERFRAISTSAMDAIILSDEEDKIIYWNPAAEKTFGFTESEAVGKKLADLVIPPHGQKNHETLLEELRQRTFSKKHAGYLALRKNGSLFPMELAVVSVQLKDKNCLLSIVRDITEWKAMEEALRQERDMLENMAANIDAGLTLIGRDYRVLWANKLMKKIYGNDLENKFCYSIYNKSNQICQDCGVKKVFENGAAVDRHDYHLKFDGRDDWVELIVTSVKDKDGKVVAALELAVNITERKRLQTKLAEYSQRLEEVVQQRTEQLKKTQAELVKSERLAAIGELAGMVGHDLRNPLSGIKNSAYFMKKKGNEISQTQAQEMLETINKCVDYSNKIVNDLLDYSREVRLELREESLKKLLTECLCLVDISEKIEISNRLNDKPVVKIDADKIKRVFINLIKNAIDAMPNGGKIIIDSNKVNANLEVSFSDTGVGIADDVLPKLFSPLFTTKAQGMGFGLAICKRIIEAHGGTITVKTIKDKGTTFTVTLPVETKLEIGGENTWINTPESSLLTTMKQ
jgi:PAS domain S-box-containing protein